MNCVFLLCTAGEGGSGILVGGGVVLVGGEACWLGGLPTWLSWHHWGCRSCFLSKMEQLEVIVYPSVCSYMNFIKAKSFAAMLLQWEGWYMYISGGGNFGPLLSKTSVDDILRHNHRRFQKHAPHFAMVANELPPIPICGNVDASGVKYFYLFIYLFFWLSLTIPAKREAEMFLWQCRSDKKSSENRKKAEGRAIVLVEIAQNLVTARWWLSGLVVV